MKRTEILFSRAWAEFSGCGLYRYELGRIWDPDLPVLGWCACNPSTADDDDLDPTTWRMVEFSLRFDFGGFQLGNAYGFRSTKPEGLWKVRDAVGPGNDAALRKLVHDTAGVVVCWGAIPKRDRVYEISKLLRAEAEALGKPLWCLRMTKGKRPQPEHPLYLPSSSERIVWP